jgi:hypothetical protein
MNLVDRGGALQLADNPPLDEQIYPQPLLERQPIVHNWQTHLSLNREAALLQLVGKARLIDALKQAGAKRAVNRERSVNNLGRDTGIQRIDPNPTLILVAQHTPALRVFVPSCLRGIRPRGYTDRAGVKVRPIGYTDRAGAKVRPLGYTERAGAKVRTRHSCSCRAAFLSGMLMRIGSVLN